MISWNETNAFKIKSIFLINNHIKNSVWYSADFYHKTAVGLIFLKKYFR